MFSQSVQPCDKMLLSVEHMIFDKEKSWYYSFFGTVDKFSKNFLVPHCAPAEDKLFVKKNSHKYLVPLNIE